MEERYIASVDLGTSKLGLCVAKVTGENVQILYYKETPAAGMRYGRILNPIKAAGPLRSAVEEAENALGIKILQVVIGLPRYGLTQETSSAKLERSDITSCITQEEIDSIKSIALNSYPLDRPDKEEIYGAAAQSFSTDDSLNCTEEDVVGMPSNILEGNFKVFVGGKKASGNIDTMLNSVGIAPARKYFLPAATADAVLSNEEKDNGVALVEIGAGVTSVTVYQGGIMRYYYAIPFGGRNITADIKYECGFHERLAENIKLAYGACMPDKLLTMSEKILQIVNEENGGEQQLSVKYLSEIITARMKEIVDAILFKIQESGYADRLRNGVVITGGGAGLTNCGNLIKEMSGYNVRIGYPKAKRFSFSGCPDIAETSAVASIGMLLIAKDDPHLNCTSEYVPSQKPAAKAHAEETEDDTKGTVFDPTEWETQEPEKKARATRRPKSDKPEDGARQGFLKFQWDKSSKSIGNIINKMYGTAE